MTYDTHDTSPMIRKMPRFAMGLLALSLAAMAGCTPRPDEQATRVPDKAPSAVADAAKDSSKDVANKDAANKDTANKDTAAPVAAADDVTINIKVQDALNANFELKSQPLLVQTDGGVVTLIGSVKTPENRSQAEQVALSVAGVKSVQNKLVIEGA